MTDDDRSDMRFMCIEGVYYINQPMLTSWLRKQALKSTQPVVRDVLAEVADLLEAALPMQPEPGSLSALLQASIEAAKAKKEAPQS